jgi:hypothetical protein
MYSEKSKLLLTFIVLGNLKRKTKHSKITILSKSKCNILMKNLIKIQLLSK